MAIKCGKEDCDEEATHSVGITGGCHFQVCELHTEEARIQTEYSVGDNGDIHVALIVKNDEPAQVE